MVQLVVVVYMEKWSKYYNKQGGVGSNPSSPLETGACGVTVAYLVYIYLKYLTYKN